jgi:hypothetical protein
MPGMPPPLPPTRAPRVQDNIAATPMSKRTTAIIGGAIAAVAVLTCLTLLSASWILKRRAARRKELSRVSRSKFSEFSFENSADEESSMRSVDAADGQSVLCFFPEIEVSYEHPLTETHAERCQYVVLNGSSSRSGPLTNTSRSSPGPYTNFPNVPLQHTVSRRSQNESQFEDQACSLTRSSSSYSRSSIETVTPRTSITDEGTSEIDLSQCKVHPVETGIACSLYENVKSSDRIERTRAVPVERGERSPALRSFWRLAHPVENFGSVI